MAETEAQPAEKSTLPRALRAGDVVGVVAPSTSMEVVDVGIVRAATTWFEDRGIKVVIAPLAAKRRGIGVAGRDRRAEDLHEMFERPDVAMVIAALGGHGCHEILPEVDFGLIRRNPKIVVGFSDFTALTTPIHAATGLTTFYGPVFTTFAQPQLPTLTVESFLDVVVRGRVPPMLGPSSRFADDEWYVAPDRKAREWQPHSGWRVVCEGAAVAPLHAACTSVLPQLAGTPWWPDLRHRTLVLESDETTTGVTLARQLTQLRQAGGLDHAAAVVYGRLSTRAGLTEAELDDLLRHIFGDLDIPVVTGFDLAHTDPLVTMPLGARLSVDTARGCIELIDPGVAS